MEFKEVSKFLAGFIAADFLVILWILYENLAPISILGLSLSKTSLIYWSVVDLILVLSLAYYAWMKK